VRWVILDRRRWKGVLNVPSGAGLVGAWTLKDAGASWSSTAGSGTIWGGIGIWMSSQAVTYSATLTLRFDLGTRTIHPEIVSLAV